MSTTSRHVLVLLCNPFLTLPLCALLPQVIALRKLSANCCCFAQTSLPEPKTKLLASAMQRWGVPEGASALLIVNEVSEPVQLASRNMERVQVNSVVALNAYDILRADRIIVEKAALKHIQVGQLRLY